MSELEPVQSWTLVQKGSPVIAQSHGRVIHEFCGIILASDTFGGAVIFSHVVDGKLPGISVPARTTAGVVKASHVVRHSAV